MKHPHLRLVPKRYKGNPFYGFNNSARAMGDDSGVRSLMCSVLIRAVEDWRDMLRSGDISADSYLVLSDKARAEGIKHAHGQTWAVNGCQRGVAQVTGVCAKRETLSFFGGRALDFLCELAGTHSDRVRAVLVREHHARFSRANVPAERSAA